MYQDPSFLKLLQSATRFKDAHNNGFLSTPVSASNSSRFKYRLKREPSKWGYKTATSRFYDEKG